MKHILLITDNTREESNLYYYYLSFEEACHTLASNMATRTGGIPFWEPIVTNEKMKARLLKKSPDKIFALYLRHFRDGDYSYKRETLPDDKYEAKKEVLLRQFVSRMRFLEGVAIKDFDMYYKLMTRGFWEYAEYDVEKERDKDHPPEYVFDPPVRGCK